MGKMTSKKSLTQKLKESWPTVRKWLIGTLLKRYLPKLAGGIWGTLITFFGGIVFDKLLKPVYDLVIRKSKAAINRLKRKPRARDLEEADNENDFNDSFDNMP